MRWLRVALVVAAACAVTGDAAKASDFLGPGLGYLPLNRFSYGYSGTLYGLGRLPVPPYYSLHPPVYYSHRLVPRPYGDSPFAHPAGTYAPVSTAPVVIINPYVPSAARADAADGPRVIENPYYRAGEASPSDKEAKAQAAGAEETKGT